MGDNRDLSPLPKYPSLQSLLLRLPDTETFLAKLVTSATQVLPHTAIGITARFGGSAVSVASSDNRARRLDEYGSEYGPCRQVLDTGVTVEIPEVTSDSRWPEYTAAVRGLGVCAVLSLPLVVDAAVLAAINVYVLDPDDSLDPDVRRRYEALVAESAELIDRSTQPAMDEARLAQLEAGLTQRSVVDQALGIVMMRQHCGPSDAFDWLRREAQNRFIGPIDLAIELIEHMGGDTPR